MYEAPHSVSKMKAIQLILESGSIHDFSHMIYCVLDTSRASDGELEYKVKYL